jgi:hypothetical protein
MISQISDVHSHFQEFPTWNYFDFQFENMGYTCICINMKKTLVCQTIDYLQMSMNIRNCLSPSEAHEFHFKIFLRDHLLSLTDRCSSERSFFLLKNIRKTDGTLKSVRAIHSVRPIPVRQSEVLLYISINFYFIENIQSQMTQTLIKYFKGELMCFRRG